MAGENETALPTKRQVTIARVFDAPRELVFDAWNDPKKVAKWWGPDGFTNPRCDWDMRPGGKILVHMRGPDGTIYPMSGTVRVVVKPERIVFDAAAEDASGNALLKSTTTVTFEAQGGKTKITVEANAVSVSEIGPMMLSGMQTGWTQSIERLARELGEASRAEEVFPGITPYLTIKGAADAIALYKKAFCAVENARMSAPDGKRLIHADITINGGRILMSDEFEEQPGCEAISAPSVERPSPVAVAIHYAVPDEVDLTFHRAIAAGCTSVMDPDNTFWNARFAVLADPFGHRWMLNAPLSQ